VNDIPVADIYRWFRAYGEKKSREPKRYYQPAAQGSIASI